MLEQFKSVVDNRYRVIAENRQPAQPVIGWMCSYVPEEIIYAAGMYPVRVMGGSGDTTGKPIVLVANKSESKAGAAGALEAFGLGLGEPIPISAEHGDGFGDLRDALADHLPDDDDEAETEKA